MSILPAKQFIRFSRRIVGILLARYGNFQARLWANTPSRLAEEPAPKLGVPGSFFSFQTTMSDVVDLKATLKKASLVSKTMHTDQDSVDASIPDNYVEHVLRTNKPLPPITWSNLAGEVQWISFIAIFIFPIVGFIGAYHTELRWQTAVWSVMYYFLTGLGMCSFQRVELNGFYSQIRYYRRISSSMGSSFL